MYSYRWVVLSRKIRDVSVITDKGTLIWNDNKNKSEWISQLIEDGRQIQHTDKNISFEESISPLQKQIQAFIDYCRKRQITRFRHGTH